MRITVVLYCIIYYNNSRVIDYPFTEEMLADGVKPNASSIFAWGRKQLGANLMDVSPVALIQTLLPRTTGTFSRKGLRVNGLRYTHDAYTESFLSGGKVTVAYLRSKIRSYESVIERNNLWHIFNPHRNKRRNRDDAR